MNAVSEFVAEATDECMSLHAENERLRKWLRWIAVDDTDAQHALRGDAAPEFAD